MHAAGVRGQRRTTIELPGVTDVSPVGSGLLWATTGAGPGETDPQNDTGQALHRIAGGKTSEVVNLFAFEERANPDGNDPHDSNPFDVEALSGNAALVVDAGGNDLLRVNKRGDVDVLATFPDQLVSTENIKDLAGCPDGPANFCGLPPMLPAEAVPTSVAIVPGDYYVGELTGLPAPTGVSRIWRVAPDASGVECGSPSPDCELVFDGGFTPIIDLRFGPDGALYVVEFDEAVGRPLRSSRRRRAERSTGATSTRWSARRSPAACPSSPRLRSTRTATCGRRSTR